MVTEKIIKLACETYKTTLLYEPDSLQVNDDVTTTHMHSAKFLDELDCPKVNDYGTTTHMHSDRFLDEHPERSGSPEFTEEEEKEQAELITTMARTFYNGKSLFDN